MTARRQIRARRNQDGIALLISIFILLLISVVAIALIVSSGTESALAGNYRSSTGVYYAALAGLEEARSRLLPKNPSYFGTTSAGFLPSSGTPLAVGSVAYVLNPGPTDNLATILTTYPDAEYDTEFGAGALAAAIGGGHETTTSSVWYTAPLNTLSFPGPLYKWVRINAVSEKSLNVPVAPSYDSPPSNSTMPVYYDGAQLNNSGSGAQVLELTALAVLPNGSQKVLQYLVAPLPIQLPAFPAALTFASDSGHTVAFSPPTGNSSYYVSGNDISVPQLPSCTPGSPVHAITTYHTNAKNDVVNGYGPPLNSSGIAGAPASAQSHYTGSGTVPDVQLDPSSNLTNYQTPAQVDAVVQNILQNANPVVLTPGSGTTPPYTSFDYDLHAVTTGMSATNPLTIVVNGNMDISNWGGDGYGEGYGLLVVTGKFTYDPDTTWNGIILVIGQGTVNNIEHGGSSVINGAMFVAQTRGPGPSFSLLSNLGIASVKFDSSMGGDGIRYSSCWIQNSIPTGSFKVLSFHEISQ